jgi:hypothetical protein
MRVLAVRHRAESVVALPSLAQTGTRKTLVTLHDERQARRDRAYGDDAQYVSRFNGREKQVVDVVAGWILTGAAPDEIR